MAHIVRTADPVRWIALVPVLVAAMLAGCANESADESADEANETSVVLGSETKIFGGTTDPSATSVVALKVGSATGFSLCSGSLIAPNVVLTARHCVAKSLTTTVSCDENGQSTNGKHVDGNQAPADIAVYVGASPKFTDAPDAVGKTIVSPDSDTLCNVDIALVVLDKAIANVQPLAVRIGAPTAVLHGESIRSVGYGQNDAQMPLGTRLGKDGVAVLALGRGVSASSTALGQNEFEVGESICEGDSGGPALSESTGAIIGVVSRGGACDDNFGHIYTATSAFASLFDKAFSIAGGAPIAEAGEAEDTQSAAHPVALHDPISGGTNPDPTQKAAAGGCSSAPAPGDTTSGAFLALVVGAVFAVRRRRS